MADITRLILRDHARLREGFADLDDAQASGDRDAIDATWRSLAELLEVHAAAEEQVFYPELLAKGSDAVDETEDAIEDHNKIRDAIRAAEQHELATAAWWEAVGTARTENSKHIAEEEREALADFRRNVDLATRDELGRRWLVFVAATIPPRNIHLPDKDPDRYIEERSP
jgi:hypothetical protein